MGKYEGMGGHATHPAPQQSAEEELEQAQRLIVENRNEDGSYDMQGIANDIVRVLHKVSLSLSNEEELQSLLVKEYGFNLDDPVFKKMTADLVLYMDSYTARKPNELAPQQVSDASLVQPLPNKKLINDLSTIISQWSNSHASGTIFQGVNFALLVYMLMPFIESHTARKVLEARIDERQIPTDLHTDSNTGEEYKMGFCQAVEQITFVDEQRIKSLKQQLKEPK
jgi:hypothetical protein